MKKNYKCRVTIIMAILSLLFGCSGNKKYNADDIVGAVIRGTGTDNVIGIVFFISAASKKE